jgi:P63C domain
MSKTLKATHEGIIDINGFKIKSYNLESGERVLSRIDFLRALGRTGKAKGGRTYDEELGLPVFLTANNLKEYIGSEVTKNSNAFIFKDLKGLESIGYKAELLPSVCYVFIDANEAGALMRTQKHIADRCKILVRGFATIGIIALVDEATGFQYDRNRDELQTILKAYISEELLKWQKRFPDSFYIEMFRLRGWDYNVKNILKRPGVIGTWTNNLIYKQLPFGVLEELKNKTPKDEKGHRKHRYHQLLTDDIGNPHLSNQITAVVTLMKASSNWRNFERLFARAFGQQEISFKEFENE